MNSRIVSVFAALLCTLPLSAQITTPATESVPVAQTTQSKAAQVATPSALAPLSADSIVVDTSADAVLVKDENHQEVKMLTGLRKRMAVEVKQDDEVVHGSVTINENGNTAEIVDANLHRTPGVVNGYRIVIFMDNSPTARGAASAARSRFMGLRTGELTYLSYDNPYFKVAVGNFVTNEDAMQTLADIKGLFPNAFIAQARINVMEFAK